MLKKYGFALCMFLLLVWGSVSANQVNPGDTKAEAVSKVILEQCINNVPRLDKIEAAAKVFNWSELTKQQALLVAPMDPDAWFNGWFVRDETAGRYMIGISRGEFDGQKVAICTIASDSVDVDEVVIDLVENLKLGNQVADYKLAGQRSRIWRANYPAEETLLFVSDAKSMNEAGFSVSIMTPDIKDLLQHNEALNTEIEVETMVSNSKKILSERDKAVERNRIHIERFKESIAKIEDAFLGNLGDTNSKD